MICFVFGKEVNQLVSRRSARNVPLKDSQKASSVGLPYGKNKVTCPVSALRAWLKAAGIERGPVFRSVDRSGHPAPHRA